MRIALLCLSLGAAALPVQAWDVGAKLSDVLASNSYTFLQPVRGAAPAFPDVELAMMSSTRDFNQPPMVLVARQSGTIIAAYGILDGAPPNAYFLFDSDGDGVLDLKTQTQKLPTWIYFNASMPRGSATAFLKDCQDMYDQFNSRQGPQNDEMTRILKNIYDRLLVRDGEDRDIDFGLFYTGETFINLAEYDKAGTTFQALKALDPRSLIADFYLATIQRSTKQGSSLLDQFKAQHPDFWTLK